ncbi:hypothetical protein QUF58_09045 [Anaerolineales bacterium HSG24]|nr:hypothetical protein [Anaerolineales bacterium HSG24]
MIVFSSILGALATISLLVLFFVLAKLSKRFGGVVKMEPIYWFYYVAMGTAGLSLLTQLIVAGANIKPDNVPPIIQNSWFLFFFYYLPLTIGVTIGAHITWRYWSWLVTERNL